MWNRLILISVGLALCILGSVPKRAAAIELGAKCKTTYADFERWSEYYKVFAYSREGAHGRYVCTYRRGEIDAITACNAVALPRGMPKCRVYARSPVNGGIAIVWREEEKPDPKTATVAPANSFLADRPLSALCQTAAQSDGAEWRKGASKSIYVAEIIRRGGSRRDCDKITGATAMATNVDPVTARYLSVRPLSFLCENAARNDSQEWRDPTAPSSIFVAELMRRGISEQQCQVVLGGGILIKGADTATARPAEPVSRRASAAMRKKHKHAVAVIIGNRKYQDGVPEVSFAHNDANAVSRFLIHSLGYRKGNIIDLRDATQSKLMAVFGTRENHKGKLFSYVRPNKSDVTIFYSGHGAPGLNDRKGYLLPVDGDPNLIEFNGYSIDLLLENVAKIETRSTMVLMDACFSGDSPKGMIVRAVSGISVTPRLPVASTAMTVITAAQGSQFASWDEDAKLGLFTNHLLKAFKGAADGEDYGNGDGVVTLAEVRAYLDDEMTYQARRRYNRDQNASIQGSPDTVLVDKPE